MSTASSGRAREHKIRDLFIDAGWLLVARSAGSKGAADLVMVHPFFGLALIQVGTANKTLGPDDRNRFVTLAEACGAMALLVSCAPRVAPVCWQVTRDVPSKWERWSL
jgi:hypothetical protein